MTEIEIIESLDNAWRALCKQYRKDCNESTRQALNMVSRIIGKVKSDIGVENKQFTVGEWLQYLSKETENE